jgi:hypothetical protein
VKIVWVVLALLGSASVEAAVPGFPQFVYQGIAVDPTLDPARYPTGEVIFPTILSTAGRFTNPLGTYYLYYAPHEAPGGIRVAYSNSIGGPWTPYGTGPVIANNWAPFYSVSHVSSPHAFWNPTEKRLFLYFHGENTTTRLATSTDGLHFTYDSAVVGCGTFGWGGGCEVSYARVFEQAITGKNNRYLMLLMGIAPGSATRNIMLAWSNDGRSWVGQKTPLITPTSAEGTGLSGPHLLRWNGCSCVAYHGSNGHVSVADVGPAFDRQSHLGVLYDDPFGLRAAAPSFVSVGGFMYMFYEQGPRLDARIAWAVQSGVAPPPTPTPTSTPRPVETAIVDNTAATGVATTGTWTASTGVAGYYGSNFIHDGNTGKGTKTVRFAPTVAGGTYRVYARWTAHANRATNVPFTIVASQTSTTVLQNQRVNGGQWVLLGTYTFAAGSSGYVQIGTAGTNGYVVADAVKLER